MFRIEFRGGGEYDIRGQLWNHASRSGFIMESWRHLDGERNAKFKDPEYLYLATPAMGEPGSEVETPNRRFHDHACEPAEALHC